MHQNRLQLHAGDLKLKVIFHKDRNQLAHRGGSLQLLWFPGSVHNMKLGQTRARTKPATNKYISSKYLLSQSQGTVQGRQERMIRELTVRRFSGYACDACHSWTSHSPRNHQKEWPSKSLSQNESLSLNQNQSQRQSLLSRLYRGARSQHTHRYQPRVGRLPFVNTNANVC